MEPCIAIYIYIYIYTVHSTSEQVACRCQPLGLNHEDQECYISNRFRIISVTNFNAQFFIL